MKAELFQPVMGTDLSVVNAARVSFSNQSDWELYDIEVPWGYPEVGKRLKQKDVNLINYLARGVPSKEWARLVHEITDSTDYDFIMQSVETLINMATHWAPFTHTAISLRMEAPVPIRTQCFKHKIGFTESEESRRYIKSTPVLYVPEHFHSRPDNVKQGSGEVHPLSDLWKEQYIIRTHSSISLYIDMVTHGVAPEEARFVLPQGVEVHWIWTGNVASYARYYNQRTDSHAQLASQELAKEVGDIIRPHFPVSWDALTSSGRTD